MEVAALELFFFDPATLDFVLAILGLFLCMLRLVISPTPTDKKASTPSLCCRPPRYVPYNGTYVPNDGTYGAPDQGQMLDV